MATQSDTIRAALVSEATPGTTPANPTFEVLRLTSEDFMRTNNNVDSAELTDSRGMLDTIRTGDDISGTLESYVIYNEVYLQVIRAILGRPVVWPPLPASTNGAQGTDLETFTYERTIPNADSRQSYYRYKGFAFHSLSMSYAPNEALTWSMSGMGGIEELAEDTSSLGDEEINGALYGDPTPSASAAQPMLADNITLAWLAQSNHQGNTALATSLNNMIHSSISITVDGQNRELTAIGSAAADIVLGKMTVSMNIRGVFRDNTIANAAAASASLDNQPGLTVTLTDSAGGDLIFKFARVKFQQVKAVTPTTASEVVYDLECVALVDENGNQIQFQATAAP